MKGLLLKDFYNISGQIKLYALYPLLGAFLSYTEKDFMMMLMFSAMMIVSIPISTFSYDDMADFTPLALTLPVSRKQLVLAKFVLSFLITLVVIGCDIVLSFIMLQVFGNGVFETNFKEQILMCLLTCFSANIINCIMFPLLYRFGTEKGRIFLFIIPFLAMGITYAGIPFISSMSETTATSLITFFTSYGLYVGAIFAIVMEVIGMYISNHIMQKKEF